MTLTLRQKLTELTELATLLPELATPTRNAQTAGPRGIAHSPAPVRLDVIHALDHRLRDLSDDAEDRAWHDRAAGGDHRQGLVPDLYQWAKLVDAEARETGYEPIDLPDGLTLTIVVDWLDPWTDWAHAQPFGHTFARDIDWWWRHLRTLAGERDDYQPRCTACHFPIAEAAGGIWQCAGCRNETSLDAGLRRLAEPLVTLTQASALTGIPLTTLKRRVAAGTLLPVTPAGERPARYRTSDIQPNTKNVGHLR